MRHLFKNLCLLTLFLFICSNSFSQKIKPKPKYEFDYKILRSAESCRTIKNNDFFKFISKYNNPVCLSGPAALLLTGLAQNNTILQKKSLFATESIGSAVALALTMKFTIGRTRPFKFDTTFTCVVNAKYNAFPSGHTAEAFAMATAMSIAVPRWYVVVPAYMWASMIAYARVYLGVHYPTDVIGGAIVGSGSTFLMYKLNKWLQATSKGNHPGNEILGTVTGLGTAYLIFKVEDWIAKKRMKK